MKIKLKSRIKVKLAEVDMKQIELADKLGLSKQTVSNIVTGYIIPSTERLFLIAHILKCKTDDLYTYEIIEESE